MAQTRRTSDPPARKEASKWGRVGPTKDRDPIHWSSCDARVLQAAIVAATEDGAAVLLSKTSDGGALALQILSGSARYKYYASNTVELDDLLREMTATANP
jgi:hypothetical protein